VKQEKSNWLKKNVAGKAGTLSAEANQVTVAK